MSFADFMKPGPVFITSGILLAIAVVSFVFFIVINKKRREHNDKIDRELKAMAQSQLKPGVSETTDSGSNFAFDKTEDFNYPRRVMFMAASGECYDIPMLETITIGNNPRCDFYVNNSTVADLHCKIIYSDGKYILQDMGSEAGTCIDGARVEPGSVTDLTSGLLQLGKANFFLTLDN